MSATASDKLLAACRLIFGVDLDPTFLDYLQQSGLRAAWRLTALRTHPDRTLDERAKRRQTERFIEARSAYSLLREHLNRRDRSTAQPPGPAARRGAPRSQHQRPAPHRRRDVRPRQGVPRRRLRLGEFLYHSRVVTFAALIETLVLQRRQRERFCEIVRRWRYLSDAQLRILLAHRRPCERIGEAAERLGLLSPFQVRLVLRFQLMRQEPLGSMLVRRGLLSHDNLEEHLSRLSAHNCSLPAR